MVMFVQVKANGYFRGCRMLNVITVMDARADGFTLISSSLLLIER